MLSPWFKCVFLRSADVLLPRRPSKRSAWTCIIGTSLPKGRTAVISPAVRILYGVRHVAR